MESLYLLIPIALIFCALVIKLLLWAIDSGQYDDLDKESWRILRDEDEAHFSAGPELKTTDEKDTATSPARDNLETPE